MRPQWGQLKHVEGRPGAWSHEAVDEPLGGVAMPSLAAGAGELWASYCTGCMFCVEDCFPPTGELRLARRAGATWIARRVDGPTWPSRGATGRSALTVGPTGEPHLAYTRPRFEVVYLHPTVDDVDSDCDGR